MAAVVINGDTSGSITLQAPAVAGSNTLTLPTLTATVAVNGPAFSAFQSSGQTLSASTWTKINFQTEEFDTANCFDNATNFRFTPNVAGYYYVTGKIQVASSACPIAVTLYKNGAASKTVMETSTSNAGIGGSALIYCNGTTDYLELYGFITISQSLSALSTATYFQAFLARGA